MLKILKTFEILICLQILIISTMIPVFIALPSLTTKINILEMPITWQIPSIILISLIYKGDVVSKTYTIYLLVGLFLLPIFHQGGSLGYLLTPNFGYLLGIYPLIKIINNYDNNCPNKIINFLKTGIIGIFIMHLTGIAYCLIQMIYLKDPNILIYNISKYSLAKIGYHILMLMPITLVISKISSFKHQKE